MIQKVRITNTKDTANCLNSFFSRIEIKAAAKFDNINKDRPVVH